MGIRTVLNTYTAARSLPDFISRSRPRANLTSTSPGRLTSTQLGAIEHSNSYCGRAGHLQSNAYNACQCTDAVSGTMADSPPAAASRRCAASDCFSANHTALPGLASLSRVPTPLNKHFWRDSRRACKAAFTFPSHRSSSSSSSSSENIHPCASTLAPLVPPAHRSAEIFRSRPRCNAPTPSAAVPRTISKPAGNKVLAVTTLAPGSAVTLMRAQCFRNEHGVPSRAFSRSSHGSTSLFEGREFRTPRVSPPSPPWTPSDATRGGVVRRAHDAPKRFAGMGGPAIVASGRDKKDRGRASSLEGPIFFWPFCRPPFDMWRFVQHMSIGPWAWCACTAARHLLSSDGPAVMDRSKRVRYPARGS
jgi:hypothetical protein